MCFECIQLSRRQFFGAAAASALAVSSFSATSALAADQAPEITPEEALKRLMAGNGKFVSAPEVCATNMMAARQAAAKGQRPWATVLACADSRVAPELIFGGTGPGELFVCRNAGNMADTATMGSIEYAVQHLGSPLVVVLGHERCGAVQAACDAAKNGNHLPGSMGPMIEPIIKAAKAVKKESGDFVANATVESAKRTASRIATGSKIVKAHVADGKVKVVYGVYSLDSGVVTIL